MLLLLFLSLFTLWFATPSPPYLCCTATSIPYYHLFFFGYGMPNPSICFCFLCLNLPCTGLIRTDRFDWVCRWVQYADYSHFPTSFRSEGIEYESNNNKCKQALQGMMMFHSRSSTLFMRRDENSSFTSVFTYHALSSCSGKGNSTKYNIPRERKNNLVRENLIGSIFGEKKGIV